MSRDLLLLKKIESNKKEEKMRKEVPRTFLTKKKRAQV